MLTSRPEIWNELGMQTDCSNTFTRAFVIKKQDEKRKGAGSWPGASIDTLVLEFPDIRGGPEWKGH